LSSLDILTNLILSSDYSEPISLYSASHETFFQNMVLILYLPIPYPFALKIKYYSPSQDGPYFIWMH